MNIEREKFLTVTQINTYIKDLMDKDELLTYVYLKGEISNFTNHYKSGHFYFSLKDETGVISAVMFKSSADKIISAKRRYESVCCGKSYYFCPRWKIPDLCYFYGA